MAFRPLPSTFGWLHKDVGLQNRVTRTMAAPRRALEGVPGRPSGRRVKAAPARPTARPRTPGAGMTRARTPRASLRHAPPF